MKTKPRGSLRTKIIAWSFVPTAVILTAFAWMAYSSTQKGIGNQAMLDDQKLVALKMMRVQQVIADLINPPAQAIMLEVDTEQGDPIEKRAQKIVQETRSLAVFDGGVFFTDQQGKVVFTWPNEKSGMLGREMAGSPGFEFARSTPGLALFLNIEPFGPGGEDCACFALSLQGAEGEFAGASFYCFLMRPDPGTVFNQAMTRADFGDQFYLLDGNQRVVYASDLSRIGSDLSGEAYLRQALADPRQVVRARKGTQDLVVSYGNTFNQPPEMKAVEWDLVREAPWSEVMRPWMTYRRQLAALLALGLALPVLLAIIGTRRITGPILELTRAAQQVTEGQFGQRIEVQTGDEIETLAGQFNVMSQKLDESYSGLEKKVADRTRELQVLNSIISTASASLDPEQILGLALKKTAEQMGFEAGAAFRAEGEAGALSLVAQRGFHEAVELPVSDDHAEVSWERKEGALLVTVPLSSKGRTLGMLLLRRSEPAELSADELSLLESVGRQVGVAVENARLYEQAEQAAIAAERHRLARELHDAVTQTLFSANLIADVIPHTWKRDPEEGLKNLEELRLLTRGALAEMRTLLLEMRPEALERADLKSLLAQLADAFVGRVRVPVRAEMQGECTPGQEVKIVFYRVAQEALNNIARHSGARQVELRLGCGAGALSLCIRDDGLGFDPALVPPDHMGLSIMRERAGSIGARLRISSQPGQGTSVELDWEAGGTR